MFTNCISLDSSDFRACFGIFFFYY